MEIVVVVNDSWLLHVWILFPQHFPSEWGKFMYINHLAYMEHVDDGGWWRMCVLKMVSGAKETWDLAIGHLLYACRVIFTWVPRKLPTPLSCTDRLPVDPDPASPEVYGNFKICHLEQWMMLYVTWQLMDYELQTHIYEIWFSSEQHEISRCLCNFPMALRGLLRGPEKNHRWNQSPYKPGNDLLKSPSKHWVDKLQFSHEQ